jgi:hypothetical protein
MMSRRDLPPADSNDSSRPLAGIEEVNRAGGAGSTGGRRKK